MLSGCVFPPQYYPKSIAFEQAGNGSAPRIACQKGNFIGNIHIGAVAERQHVTDIHAAPFGLPQCKTERARLTDDAYAGAARLVHTHLARGKRHHRAGREIDEAQAIRADDFDARFARNRGYARLLRGVIGIAGLRITGRKHHSATDTVVRAIEQRGFDAFARHGEHGAIRLFRERGNRRIAGFVADFFVARIDAQNPALITRHIGYGARPERLGIGRCTEYGDAPGVKQALQFVMAINAAGLAAGRRIHA